VLLRRPFDDDDDVDGLGLDTLADVQLVYFKAEPPSIGAFGSSSLVWKVDGPSSGFSVRLEGTQVAKAGSITVQPKFSQTYRLYASAGGKSKFLGSATVNVNLARCVSIENQFVEALVKAALQETINADSGVYFRKVPKKDAYGNTYYAPSEPEVIVTDGQIRFILKLGSYLNNFPNPDVDIDVRFGLHVTNDPDPTSIFDSVSSVFGVQRRVVPVNVYIDVHVSVPWWAWLIPGALPGLAIAIDMGEEEAQRKMRTSLPRLVNEAILKLIFAAAAQEPDGIEPHSVRVHPGGLGTGVVEVTFCPSEIPPIIENP
jgi:hypothetical protein